MHRFQRGKAAIAAATALLVAAGGAVVGAPAAQALTQLRMGTTVSSVASAGYWLAKGGNNILAQNGLQVTPTVFASATGGMAALAGDQIDIMYANIPFAISARVNGDMDIRMIAPAEGMSRRDVVRAKKDIPFGMLIDQASICVNKDSGIKTWADLSGKRIGTAARNGSSEIGMVDAMQRAGAEFRNIQWAVGPPATLIQQLLAGKLDAVLTGSPFIEVCVAGGGIDMFQPTLELVPNGGPLMGYWAKTSWVNANPAAVKAFQKSVYQMAIASRKPDTMRSIMTAGSELTKQPLEVMLAGAPLYIFENTTKADLDQIVVKMVKYGFLKRAANTAEMLASQYRPGS